jgi:AcrR family transcriptional regulator
MPKIVNHDQRKIELGEAVWRVIRAEGLEHVTVRRVAREAGMSLGSLRHYFVTQSDLIAFSMQLVSNRVKDRIAGLKLSGDLRRDFLSIVGEVLPLDDERRAEAEVWLAFTGRSLVDPALASLRNEVHDELYRFFRSFVERLVKVKPGAGTLDIECEAKRLHALVDGLTVHCISRPDLIDADDVQAILNEELDALWQRA